MELNKLKIQSLNLARDQLCPSELCQRGFRGVSGGRNLPAVGCVCVCVVLRVGGIFCKRLTTWGTDI